MPGDNASLWSLPEREALPLILIRGFGGLGVEDEKRITYQGFNDGTVYHQKRGENYIYEGLVLRFMKSDWEYQDATNVVNYYARPIEMPPSKIDSQLASFTDRGFFSGSKVIIDHGMASRLLKSKNDLRKSLWVFRYYDLDDRQFDIYGAALVRLIDLIRALTEIKYGKPSKVNIIAHSMGGLVVRHAIQGIPDPGKYKTSVPETYATRKAGPSADDCINKIVTLGTPHKGVTTQILGGIRWLPLNADEELSMFNPKFQDDATNPTSYLNFHKHFDPRRLLTVVGTNYGTYAIQASSWLNRLVSVAGEFGLNYNRSDGLVKQDDAQIDGSPRAFVHKCHGGNDSLVTSRESYEIATRFFFGNVSARLKMISGQAKRGKDMFGKSEYFLGVSIKPRFVDFELFHQSKEAENCYGPFSATNQEGYVDFSDPNPRFGWAGPEKLIWEGWLNAFQNDATDMVLRLEFYVGERDLLGIGFSDNIIFQKQYYVRAASEGADKNLVLYLHTSEGFMGGEINSQLHTDPMKREGTGWKFKVEGTGFEGEFLIELDEIPIRGFNKNLVQPPAADAVFEDPATDAASQATKP